jgi:hypothetical protein
MGRHRLLTLETATPDELLELPVAENAGTWYTSIVLVPDYSAEPDDRESERGWQRFSLIGCVDGESTNSAGYIRPVARLSAPSVVRLEDTVGQISPRFDMPQASGCVRLWVPERLLRVEFLFGMDATILTKPLRERA